MDNLLEKIGLTPFEIIAILLVVFLAKELWSIFKTYRIKTAYEYLAKLVDEIDCQLKEFYLPLRERFIASKLLFETTGGWLTDGEYKNETLHIISEDPKALRKIMIWKLYLPFNREIETIILENSHRKNIEDNTNYEKILKHILIWKAFEESIQEGLIEYYDAEETLTFPKSEADSCIEMCDKLLERKKEIINQVLSLGAATKKILIGNQFKNGG